MAIFPTDLNLRATVKVTDKLLIHNIDTGVTEYTTVQKLLEALSIVGNVGIGTTTPADKLYVIGRIGAEGVVYFRGPNVVDAGDTDPQIYRIVGGPLAIATNGAEVIRILTNGNVGIGTATPTSKLDVVGIPEHADNAAALLAGLTAGAFYRTGDDLKVVH